ncbi:MAG: hypothetical protein WCJ30_14500 [Deltaproteobacteria bacterium]
MTSTSSRGMIHGLLRETNVEAVYNHAPRMPQTRARYAGVLRRRDTLDLAGKIARTIRLFR